MALANDSAPYTRPDYDVDGDFDYNESWFHNNQVLTIPGSIDDCKKIVIYIVQTCLKGRCLTVYIYQNVTDDTRVVEELYDKILFHCKKKLIIYLLEIVEKFVAKFGDEHEKTQDLADAFKYIGIIGVLLFECANLPFLTKKHFYYHLNLTDGYQGLDNILKLLTNGTTATGLLHKLLYQGFSDEDIFIVHSDLKSFVLKYGTDTNLLPLRNPKKDQDYSVHGGLIETCKNLQDVTSSKALRLTTRTDKYEHRTQLEDDNGIFNTDYEIAQNGLALNAPATPTPRQIYDWKRIDRLVEVRVTKDLRQRNSNVTQDMVQTKVGIIKQNHLHQILHHCDFKLWIKAHTNLELDKLRINPKLKDVCDKITQLFKDGITEDDFKRIQKTLFKGIDDGHINHEWYNNQTVTSVETLEENLKKNWVYNGKDCDAYIKYLAHDLLCHYEKRLLENEEMDKQRRTKFKQTILRHIQEGGIKPETYTPLTKQLKRNFICTL